MFYEDNPVRRTPRQNQVYEHFEGETVKVIAVAVGHDHDEALIVYQMYKPDHLPGIPALGEAQYMGESSFMGTVYSRVKGGYVYRFIRRDDLENSN